MTDNTNSLSRSSVKPIVKQEIISDRFALRPLAQSDLNSLHQLWTDKAVRHFLWDNKIVSIKETEEILEKNQHLFSQSGFGIWGINEHKSAELIGFAGFWYFRWPANLELLFGAAPAYWNRGIATEAGSSVIRYGFNVLGFDRVEASTDFANTASIRVLEKLSMRVERRATLDGLDTIFYALTRDQWLKNQ